MLQRLTSSLALVALATSAVALPAEAVAPIFDREYPVAIRRLFESAKSRIDIQLYQARFYTQYPDTVTNKLLTDLIAARKRGVEVNIVIDTGDWNPSQKNEYNLDFVDRLTTSGVRVWVDAKDEVSHQKVITVDDSITVVASTNWSFYSTDNNHEAGVVIESPAVNKWFREYFWQRAAGGAPRANATTVTLSEAPVLAAKPVARGAVHLKSIADFPSQPLPVDDVEPIPNRLFYPAVEKTLNAASSDILVVQRSLQLSARSPKATGLPGEPPSSINVLAEAMVTAARRGVKVSAILDKTEGMEGSDNDTASRFLKAGGVKVMEEDPNQQTHAKMLMVDNDKVIVGSTNWTREAVEDGNEASVLVRSREVNRVFRDYASVISRGGNAYKATATSIWEAPPELPKKK